MTISQAFLQGLIQGLTEFLPVSSSGHLSLFQYLTGNNSEEAFLFSILLHAGTLVAVFICFFRTLCRLIYEACVLVSDLFHRKLNMRRLPPERRTVIALLVSTLPLGLMLLLKDVVASCSADNDIVVEGFCFLITSFLLLTASRAGSGRKNGGEITWKDSLYIGVAQMAATMPGISRSGSTISTGLLRGLSREYAVSYSFILGIPAVLGAIVLEVGDAVEAGVSLPLPILLTGFVSAVVFGVLSIKLVQWLIKGNKFRLFGYYTLVLGVVVLSVGIIDHLAGFPVQNFITTIATRT